MKTTTKQTEIPSTPAEKSAQHSPLPWTNHDDDYPSEKRFTIKSPWTETHKPGDAEGYGDYRGLTVCIIEHQGDGAPVVTKRQAKANADFIVEACNNYERVKAERDELLAALKFAIVQIDELTDYDGTTDTVCYSSRERAAIAKAEGSAK